LLRYFVNIYTTYNSLICLYLSVFVKTVNSSWIQTHCHFTKLFQLLQFLFFLPCFIFYFLQVERNDLALYMRAPKQHKTSTTWLPHTVWEIQRWCVEVLWVCTISSSVQHQLLILVRVLILSIMVSDLSEWGMRSTLFLVGNFKHQIDFAWQKTQLVLKWFPIFLCQMLCQNHLNLMQPILVMSCMWHGVLYFALYFDFVNNNVLGTGTCKVGHMWWNIVNQNGYLLWLIAVHW